LLFLIQPMMARVLLPWYGGSSSVWAACILFFQGGLLAGNIHVHGWPRAPHAGRRPIGPPLASSPFLMQVMSLWANPPARRTHPAPLHRGSFFSRPPHLCSSTGSSDLARRTPYRLYARPNPEELSSLSPGSADVALATRRSCPPGMGCTQGFVAIGATDFFPRLVAGTQPERRHSQCDARRCGPTLLGIGLPVYTLWPPPTRCA
jgi:hypothetical protein